jgi:hypothetical protein
MVAVPRMFLPHETPRMSPIRLRKNFAGVIAALGILLYAGSPAGVRAADPAKAADGKPTTKAAEKKPAAPKPPAYLDAKEAGPDFALQGEYTGKVSYDKGQADVGFQVIALGDGEFRGVFYYGGLPGAGWDKLIKYEADGKRTNDEVVFENEKGIGRLRDGQLSMFTAENKPVGILTKTERKSPTLGAAPPAGAVVLFDGTNADAFKGGKLSPEGWLMEGSDTNETFGSCELHLEFRTPFMPTARGQARGNSGCYLQSRYETQILDSFGLAGKNNECGGLYEIKDPDVNMCLPPLAWQTYDISYTRAKFDADGKKTADARITVRHNGVVVQDDVRLPHTTRAAPLKEGPEPGPLHLQNHGNPVRFRNIWLVRK